MGVCHNLFFTGMQCSSDVPFLLSRIRPTGLFSSASVERSLAARTTLGGRRRRLKGRGSAAVHSLSRAITATIKPDGFAATGLVIPGSFMKGCHV